MSLGAMQSAIVNCRTHMDICGGAVAGIADMAQIPTGWQGLAWTGPSRDCAFGKWSPSGKTGFRFSGEPDG